MHGDVTIKPPQLVTSGAIAAPYDVVFFTIKGYELGPAIEDFAPAVGANTMILPMLNGMRHIDALIARFGDAAVIGGLCYCATKLDDRGRILQIGPMQQVVYGERDGRLTPRIEALDATMQGAGVGARVDDDPARDVGEVGHAPHLGCDHVPDARHDRPGRIGAGRDRL